MALQNSRSTLHQIRATPVQRDSNLNLFHSNDVRFRVTVHVDTRALNASKMTLDTATSNAHVCSTYVA